MAVYPAYPKDLDRFIFADSPPATRRDGSPIQIGDRFKSIRDDYFWDGSRWLNTTICTASIPQFQANTIGNTTIFTGEILPNVPIWVEDCTVTVTSPNFASAGNTSILMKIGLPRPQELIIAATLLIERNLVTQPLIAGDNIFPVNTFRAIDAAGRRKLQIEFIPAGGTFNTVMGYFFLILNYRRVYV